MDFAKALTFPFDDEDWLKKLGMGVLVTVGGALLSFLLLIPLIIMVLLFQGWTYEIMKRVKNNDPTPLPGWDDFGGLLKRGLTLVLALIVYQIPTLIFACAILIITVVLPLLSGDSAEGFAALTGVAGLIAACCGCLIAIYSIAASLVYYAGLIRYTDREEFGTFMQFGDNLSLFRENAGDFGMAILFLIGGGLIAGLVSGTGIGGLITPTFQAYFSGHVLGQLAAKLKGGAPAM
jgi:hypothetical protein